MKTAVARVAPCPKGDVDCVHQYTLNHEWDPFDPATAKSDCENAPREPGLTPRSPLPEHWYPDLALCTSVVLKSR